MVRKTKETIDHKSRKHALLSPSKAYQWMGCPGSALLTKDMPNTTSSFAEEGTRAHEMAQAMLSAYLKGNGVSEVIDESICKEVEPYVNRAINDFENINEETGDAVMMLEQDVDFSEYVPGGKGSADLIIVAGNTLYVRDLKFGKGVKVEAKGNPQLRCYELGAYLKQKDIYDIDTVVGQIDMVRLDHFTEERISVEELLKWASETLKPAAEAALKEDAPIIPGEHCKFCKAEGTCRKRAEMMMKIEEEKKEAESDSKLMSSDEIASILKRAIDLDSWVNFLKETVTASIMSGTVIPGWKVVEGRSLRRWTDDLAVAQRMQEKGFDPAVLYNKKLIGITDMQKLCGGKKQLEDSLGDLIEKPQGKPTLVEESDKRPAIETDDFKDIK